CERKLQTGTANGTAVRKFDSTAVLVWQSRSRSVRSSRSSLPSLPFPLCAREHRSISRQLVTVDTANCERELRNGDYSRDDGTTELRKDSLGSRDHGIRVLRRFSKMTRWNFGSRPKWRTRPTSMSVEAK